MHRILLVARRDFLAAIRSKPFLFGLIVAPILFGGGFIGIAIMKAKPDIAERRIAIVDRTGGAAAASVIESAADKNSKDLYDKITGRQVTPRYVFETVAPDDAHPEAQRLALSDRVRRHELFAFVEIGRDALHPPKAEQALSPANPSRDAPASSRVDYYSNAGGIDDTRMWLSGPLSDGLRRARLAQLGIDRSRFDAVLAPATVQTMSLLSRDEKTGEIREAHKRSEAEAAIPFVLMMILAMMVLMSAGPMLGSVADDKQQRVFEMLLGSASPFELMLGKVVAAVGLTLTSSILYIAGGIMALEGFAMIGVAPFGVLPWFFVYLVADVLVISSLSIAVGSACSSPNDAQHLAMIAIGPTLIPLFVIAPIMQVPNGPFATVMSLIPPFTPLIMLMRQASPGGVPGWQPWVGLAGVLLWTVAATWAAARIFRIGILMQGKTPKVSELLHWAVRG
jgi:ABC-2 type transport system permease protein